jgi:hypothetical protein
MPPGKEKVEPNMNNFVSLMKTDASTTNVPIIPMKRGQMTLRLMTCIIQRIVVEKATKEKGFHQHHSSFLMQQHKMEIGDDVERLREK